MTFEKVVSFLDEKVCKGVLIKWNDKDMANCKSDAYKMGVFYAFSKKREIVYVGLIGGGAGTCLYDRYSGHGWGSLEDAIKRRNRMELPAYVRFHRFENQKYDMSQLRLIKRLLIWKHKPAGTRIPPESKLRKDCWQLLVSRDDKI